MFFIREKMKVLLAFGVTLKSVVKTNVKEYLPVFSSWSFTVWDLMFSSLIHLESIFVSSVR